MEKGYYFIIVWGFFFFEILIIFLLIYSLCIIEIVCIYRKNVCYSFFLVCGVVMGVF